MNSCVKVYSKVCVCVCIPAIYPQRWIVGTEFPVKSIIVFWISSSGQHQFFFCFAAHLSLSVSAQTLLSETITWGLSFSRQRLRTSALK